MAASLPSWDGADVESWLRDVEERPGWADVFARNHITGLDLLDLSAEDARSMGLPPAAFECVRRLRRGYFAMAARSERAASPPPAYTAVHHALVPCAAPPTPDWPVPATRALSGLRRVNKFLRQTVFGRVDGCRWAVHHDVAYNGDCFFDCVRMALNSARPRTVHTVRALRKLVALGITAETLDDFQCDYIANAPATPVAEAYRRVDSADAMRRIVLGSDHYATLIDIRTVSERLGVHFIVLNNRFRGEQSTEYDRRFCPLLSQTPSRAKYDAEPADRRLFVVLLRNGEHFELVVHVDTEVDNDTRQAIVATHRDDLGAAAAAAADPLPRHVYRGVFAAAELPPELVAAYEATMI